MSHPATRRVAARAAARRVTLIGWALLVPALAAYLAFVVWPLLLGVQYSFYDWNGVGALQLCEIPTLLLTRAAADKATDVVRLLAIKPDIEVGMTVGAGHFIQLEVPEQVNAMIERFLTLSV